MLDNVTLDKYLLNHITDVLIRVSRETICYQTQANDFSFAFLRRVVFALVLIIGVFHVKHFTPPNCNLTFPSAFI